MPMSANDLTGETFGKLTVAERYYHPTDKRVYWTCVCSCASPNRIRHVRADNLTMGKTVQCETCQGARRADGPNSGAKKGLVAPKYIVRMYVAPSEAIGKWPCFAVVVKLGSQTPIITIEINDRVKPARSAGFPPGTMGALAAMQRAGLIAPRTGQFATWLRREGVEFNRVDFDTRQALTENYRLFQSMTLPSELVAEEGHDDYRGDENDEIAEPEQGD